MFWWRKEQCHWIDRILCRWLRVQYRCHLGQCQRSMSAASGLGFDVNGGSKDLSDLGCNRHGSSIGDSVQTGGGIFLEPSCRRFSIGSVRHADPSHCTTIIISDARSQLGLEPWASSCVRPLLPSDAPTCIQRFSNPRPASTCRRRSTDGSNGLQGSRKAEPSAIARFLCFSQLVVPGS